MYDLNPHPRLRNTRALLLQIPEEILMDDILPRLPVKSLSRFKCVSNSWRSLIESDRFMKIQYRNSAKNPRVIFSNSNSYAMKECSLQSLNSKEGSDPRKNEAGSGTYVGCCNGVVCCYDYKIGRFSLWNPAIRVCIELPDCEGRGFAVKCGFGWDETSGVYKVFTVLSHPKSIELIGRIYSSNTKSWRTIPCGSLFVFCRRGAFLRGNLHWVDRHHSQIECFNLEREEFGKIELPFENAAKVPFYFPLLGEIGKSLSILIGPNKSLEVWVMKEYGVKDSWFKLLSFAFPFPHTLCDTRIFAFFPLFGEGPNGEICLCYAEDLVVYSPKEGVVSLATNKIDFHTACFYVESLVSPKRILDA